MIRALLAVTVPGFVLGGLGMAVANRHAAREVAHQRWLKFAVYCAIVHVVLGAAALGAAVIRLLYLGIVVIGTAEFWRAWQRLTPPRPWRASVAAILVAAGAVAATLLRGVPVLVWCFVVTACADGFAQVVGQLIGRRRLAPRTSPGKTVEGAVGGLFAAVIGSCAMRDVVGLSLRAALVWGALLAVAGLAGDLGASWLKRRAALKDYSQLLPGQGGFLDRFDSLLAALLLVAVAWRGPG